MLFDDYRGETRYQEMLKICHEHKFVGNVKGTSATINPSVVIITSNEPWTMWEKWLGHDRAPWERRVTDLLEFDWAIEDGETIPHVTVKKGQFLPFDDPPAYGIPAKTDQQIEDILAIPRANGSRWLAGRKRTAPEGGGQKKPRVDHKEWDMIINDLPEVEGDDEGNEEEP